jgi:cyanophycinase
VLRENEPYVILIGGHEDKVGPRTILGEVALSARGQAIVIATLASEEAPRQWETYRSAFTELGVGDVRHLQIENRDDASNPKCEAILEGAGCIFFTGGDQLKITSKILGTSLYSNIRSAHENGSLALAGTSAGASAMGETMLVSTGPPAEYHKVKSAFSMAHGLALVRDMVIDQHFAQRARIERLVGSIGENPGVLGIGIDEDTAVVIRSECARITGAGAVYIVDGSGVTYSNVSERASESALCLFDVRLHVMVHGSSFNLITRRPSPPEPALANE